LKSKFFVRQEPKKFFISFKDRTGESYATHLYYFLKEDCAVDVFYSNKELLYDVKRGEWEVQIDDALNLSKVFILIVTPTTNISEKIKKELNYALNKNGVEVYYFIHENIWNVKEQTIIKLEGKEIDLKKSQCKCFKDEVDLANKVYATIPMIKSIQYSNK